jgi:poly(hydroxyalkanoate) granule-associated protein
VGAFSKAQAEGGKVFEALIKEGTNLQRKTQGLAEERINAVTGKMTAMADGMSNKAGAHWDKLESIFEERVAKALNKMGVLPLGHRCADQAHDELSRAAARPLADRTGRKAAAPMRKAPARKPGRRRSRPLLPPTDRTAR